MRWRDDGKDNDYINNTNIPSLRVNADTYREGPGTASTKKQRTTYGRRRFVIRVHPLDPAGDRAGGTEKAEYTVIRQYMRQKRSVLVSTCARPSGSTRSAEQQKKKINFLIITLNRNE